MKIIEVIGAYAGVLFVVMLISAAIGSVCWTYSINTWLLFFGKTTQIAWWQGALIGFIPAFGQMSFVVAALTWIATLFFI